MSFAKILGIIGIILVPVPIIGFIFPLGEIIIGMQALEKETSKIAGKTHIKFGIVTIALNILFMGFIYLLSAVMGKL